MANTFMITCYGKTETYPESQRKKLIRFYYKGAVECDGSEGERYAYITDSLSMGAVDVNGDKETSVFPEGSEGALFEEQLLKEMEAFSLKE